ncbi:MAG TPA: VCBS repeat-containing protein [Planctomycetota bacterium]
MRRCGCLLALVCTAIAMPAQARPEVTALQLPKTMRLTGFLDVDVDGVHGRDLVLACFDETTKRRELRTHLRSARTPVFAGEPSATPYALERDVIAFTFADVDARAGRELVLFTAERAVAVLPAAEGAPKYEPLFTHRLLWAAPDPTRVLALDDVVHDVDGDGRDDFLLPEVDGARLVLQRLADGKTGFAATLSWQLPAWRSPLTAGTAGGPARVGGGEMSLRLGLLDDGYEEEQRPLVDLRARAPRFLLLDLGGDGVRDGLAVRNDSIWCWAIGAGAAIAAAPASIALPLPEDRLTLFDPAFDVQLADVNGDRRADLLLTTSAQRNDEVEVRIDVFFQQIGQQRPDAGPWAAKPDGRLRVQPLATTPQLVDADGDGQLDLVVNTVRTDLLRGLTGGGPTSLQVQFNVFRGGNTGFQVPAMLNQQLQLPVATEGRGPFLRVLGGPAGTPGALLLRNDDVMALQPLQREGASLRLMPQRWQVPIAKTARPRLARGASEVLLVDEHELLHVRWQ